MGNFLNLFTRTRAHFYARAGRHVRIPFYSGKKAWTIEADKGRDHRNLRNVALAKGLHFTQLTLFTRIAEFETAQLNIAHFTRAERLFYVLIAAQILALAERSPNLFTVGAECTVRVRS